MKYLLFLVAFLLFKNAESQLIISEIMYNPNDRGSEFFELKNIGSSAVDLVDYRIGGGVAYIFVASTTVNPGQWAVLCANQTDFQLIYNRSATAQYVGKLGNKGDNIQLQNPSGTIVYNMTYGTKGLWPSSADGNGFSLVPVNPNSNPNPELPSSWRISTFVGGSPFADDTGPSGPISAQYAAIASFLKITEIMYNPAPGGVIDGDEFEFLEFKNIGSTPLNLTGLIIEDAVNYVFPSGASSLAAGAFWVVAGNISIYSTRYTSTPASGAYTGKLSDTGERIAAVDPRGNILINLTYDQNSPWPGAAGSGVGFSLVPVNPASPGVASDPASWRSSTKILGTPFADDTGPTGPVDTSLLVLRVTEIMYGSTARGFVKGSEFEFVEVKNTGSSSIDVSNCVFANGIYHAIPPNTTLGSGQFLVFAANSSTFNSRYGRAPSFGYKGTLSDKGEKLTIIDRNGNPFLSFTFNNTAPWPTLNGTDYSLVPVQPNSNPDPNDASNWRRSTNQGGSPFADDPTTPTSLIATSTSSGTATSSSLTSGSTSAAGSTSGNSGMVDAGEKINFNLWLSVLTLMLLKLIY